MTANVPQPPSEKKPIPGVAAVIGIASGKGGVGKSTVAVNLACALSARGARVGLMDADMYGPSIPIMMDAFEDLEGDSKTKKLCPVERYGVKLMSIGFMNPSGDPIIWRGPIVSRALQQLMNEADWGQLDYLLVDLPPGTGDAPLTLAQYFPLNGVVIVFTPQDVALNIASKSLAMFQRPPFEVPILGIVENMSGFICPHCHEETAIFGPPSGARTAQDFGVSFLGSVPLSPVICEAGDMGKPIVVSAPDSLQGQAFIKIADQVADRIRKLRETEKKPGGFIGLERLGGLLGPRKPARTVKSYTPLSGPPGTKVIIAGAGLTGITGVSFNGINAPFTIDSDSQVTATVPAGGSGKISLTASNGPAIQLGRFTVTG